MVLFLVFAHDFNYSAANVRRLDIVPIFAPITFADDEVDVVRKFFGVVEIEAPLPVMITVVEFAGCAIGNADLPDSLTKMSWRPLELAKRFLFGGGDSEVGESEFSEDAVGDGVQGVMT